MAYRNRQHNTKKIVSLILIIALIICIPIVYRYFTNKEDGNDFISNIIKPGKPTVETLEVGFEDYLRTPDVNYKLYSKAPKVKGLYVNSSAVHSKKRFNTLIDIANTTEINAFVIDVKNDSGRITFDMDNPQSDEIQAEIKYMRDINATMDTLYENDIYPIARVVAFKDPWSSKKLPDLAIKNKDGSLWMYDKISWLNPYHRETWDYILNIAKKAAEVGFKEIQFDYIRFEATRSLNNAEFGKESENKSRMEVISEFVAYAMKELEPYNVKVSADVFGTIITSKVDARNIGQDYLAMAEKLDVICPMVYPSHYGKGFFGIPKDKHSDLYPYETILGSMEDSNEKYAELEGKKAAIVRPWLQAFTASYLRKPNYKTYGPEEIRAQIQATYDAGLEEWILWHAGSKYNKDALLKE